MTDEIRIHEAAERYEAEVYPLDCGYGHATDIEEAFKAGAEFGMKLAAERRDARIDLLHDCKRQRDELETEVTRLKGIERDHLNDWRRIQDAERKCEALEKEIELAQLASHAEAHIADDLKKERDMAHETLGLKAKEWAQSFTERDILRAKLDIALSAIDKYLNYFRSNWSYISQEMEEMSREREKIRQAEGE